MHIDLRAAPGWSFDDVEVRADERRVLRGGIAQPLGSRAFDLLRVLIERRGQVVTKGFGCGRAWWSRRTT